MRRAVAVVLFVNAFLVFVLQPHISKRLLPLLGGSAEVWIICTLFFQGALLAGYALAFAARRLPLSVSLSIRQYLLLPVISSGPVAAAPIAISPIPPSGAAALVSSSSFFRSHR